MSVLCARLITSQFLRAAKVITSRKTKVQSWFLDLNLVMGYWGSDSKRAYHHTAPVNSLYALHEALVILQEEGLENAWRRHALHHQAFAAGIKALGLGFVVDAEYRLPQLNAVSFPSVINDAEVRSLLLNDYNLEIGSGLGSLAGKVWRIGLMGFASSRENVLFCLSALANVLAAKGMQLDHVKAIAAAQLVYGEAS